ncbi:MAG: CapA family protein [Candidatus Azobacteroides sp.]|nr:CapA family protein [Candidatus Azobacteroides sp.]
MNGKRKIIEIIFEYFRRLLLVAGIFFLLCFSLTLNAQELRLLFAGDAMQHKSQIDNAFRNGKYDYSSYFRYVKYEISRADLAVVNLEGPLGGKPYKGYPTFSIPDEFAVALKDAGFSVFLTANNHAVDCYSKGIKRTIDTLDSLGVYHTGTFKNSLERELDYPLIVEKNGIRMAFLNYTYDTNGINPETPYIVNNIDTALIKEDILKAQLANPDVIIAAMHWGEEYKLNQSKSQEQLALFIINQGVDLIIGSHPHVVQPSQIFTDSVSNRKHLIVYSLGNFVSGMSAVNTDGGQMISVKLKKANGKTQIESCGTLLFYTQQKKVNGKIDFTLIPITLVEEAKSMLPDTNKIEPDSRTYEKMMRFANNARSLFRQYNVEVNERRFSDEKSEEDDFLKFIPLKFEFRKQICNFAPQK